MLGNSISGLRPKEKRALYISNVLPVLSYGAAVWWHPSWKGQKWIAVELQKAQTKAVRWITGAFRTTPIGAMEMAAGVVPIRHQIDRLMKNNCARVRTLHENHPTRSILPEYWEGTGAVACRTGDAAPQGSIRRKKAKARTAGEHIDRIGRSFNEEFALFHAENHPGKRLLDQFHEQIHFDVDGPKKHSEEFNEWMRTKFWQKIKDITADRHAVSLYTDGSRKNPDEEVDQARAGAAWLVLRGAQHIVSERMACGRSTAYDAEMFGLAYGIKCAVKHSRSRTKQIHIFTDNKSALNKIFRTNTKSAQILTVLASHHARKFLDNRPDRCHESFVT